MLNNQGGKWTKWELTRAGIMVIMKQQKMSNTIYLYFNKLEDMIAPLLWPRSNMFIHLSSVIWPFTSPLRWPLKFWICSASWMLFFGFTGSMADGLNLRPTVRSESPPHWRRSNVLNHIRLLREDCCSLTPIRKRSRRRLRNHAIWLETGTLQPYISHHWCYRQWLSTLHHLTSWQS